MKKQLLLLFAFLPTLLFSQLTETTVSDSNFVRIYKSGLAKGDTSYFLTNNRPIGKWIIYFDEAKTKKALETEFFERNELKFTTTEWYRDGSIKCIIRLSPKMDTSTQIYYYKNGRLRNKTIYKWNPRMDGWAGVVDSSYYENGQIKQTPIDWTSLKKQHIVYYYDTGVKKQEINWVNGTLVDEYVEYFENGKKKKKGMYAYPPDLDPTSVPSSRTEIEIGTWKYFNEKGKLIKEEYYENGKLISSKEKQ